MSGYYVVRAFGMSFDFATADEADGFIECATVILGHKIDREYREVC